MKKLFFMGCALTSIISADMKFNVDTFQFYTLPISSKIDQEVYNGLVIQIHFIQIQFMNNGIYGKATRDHIKQLLRTLNSPTSLRFLSDLEMD